MGMGMDLEENVKPLQAQESKVGRVIVHAVPTGVEVGHATLRGGRSPAPSNGCSTSMDPGDLSFARPVAYQSSLEAALPEALKSANPLKILRFWNNAWSSDATGRLLSNLQVRPQADVVGRATDQDVEHSRLDAEAFGADIVESELRYGKRKLDMCTLAGQ